MSNLIRCPICDADGGPCEQCDGTGRVERDIRIRWLIKRDMPEVMAIENACFPIPWSEEEFIAQLRQRNCIGMVADIGNIVVGYVLYELHQQHFALINIAVDPHFQREGVATEMIDRMKSKLSQERRIAIISLVRESNLDAQLFFKSQGFEATATVRDHYEETAEDAYYFEYVLRQVVNNRVKEYF